MDSLETQTQLYNKLIVYLANTASLKEKTKIELKKIKGLFDYKGKVICNTKYISFIVQSKLYFDYRL